MSDSYNVIALSKDNYPLGFLDERHLQTAAPKFTCLSMAEPIRYAALSHMAHSISMFENELNCPGSNSALLGPFSGVYCHFILRDHTDLHLHHVRLIKTGTVGGGLAT